MLQTISYILKHNFTLMQEPYHSNTHLLKSLSLRKIVHKVGAGKISMLTQAAFIGLNTYTVATCAQSTAN